jgi:methionyl-tRNA formyltransferase
MTLVFMGTPDFAVPILESLHARHQVSLVVTQPDRPKGRGRALAAPPVKEKAQALGIPVLQPESLKTPEFHEAIRREEADLLVVVAFRILPDTLFPLAKHGAVNVHGSLLPRYRGAAPIQWAVASGDTKTGVTIFKLDKLIDHGGILSVAKTPIGEQETAGELFDRLRILGRDLLLATLEDMETGTARPMEQDHAAASPAPKLKKEDGLLDWTLPSAVLHARIRGFNPYPVCYSVAAAPSGLAGRVLRVYASRIADGESPPALSLPAGGPPPPPGALAVSADRHPLIRTGSGWLKLVEMQWEGKPRVKGPDFVNGLQGAEREALQFGKAP